MLRFLVLQTLPKPAAFSPNNALLTLARRLDRSRFAMTVAVPRAGLLTQALEREGIPVALVSGLRTYRRHDALWRFPVVALKVAHLARRTGAKLLVSNHAELGPFANAAARLTGNPWICFLRQADRPSRYYDKYRVARADAVASVSAAALGSYQAYLTERKLPPHPMRVIPTGIDAPPCVGPGGSGNDRDTSPGLPTVGTVGLRGVKRPGHLLEIFARVRRQVPSARCMLIGGGDPAELENLRSLAASLGLAEAVDFPGQRREMGEWYRRMNVYAHTSRSEALPKVVLEAMVHALPVVSFDVGGIGEAVVSGETGFLCAEGDLDAFASGLTQLLSDPALARRFGAAGRIRAEQHFSPMAMAEGMMALFIEVLSGRGAASTISSPRAV